LGSARQRAKSAKPESWTRGAPPFEPQAKPRNSLVGGCAATGSPSLRSHTVARRNCCAWARAVQQKRTRRGVANRFHMVLRGRYRTAIIVAIAQSANCDLACLIRPEDTDFIDALLGVSATRTRYPPAAGVALGSAPQPGVSGGT